MEGLEIQQAGEESSEFQPNMTSSNEKSQSQQSLTTASESTAYPSEDESDVHGQRKPSSKKSANGTELSRSDRKLNESPLLHKDLPRNDSSISQQAERNKELQSSQSSRGSQGTRRVMRIPSKASQRNLRYNPRERDSADDETADDGRSHNSSLRQSSGAYRRSGVTRRPSKTGDGGLVRSGHKSSSSSIQLSPPNSPGTLASTSSSRQRRKSRHHTDPKQEGEEDEAASKARRRRARSSSRDPSSSQGRHRSTTRDNGALSPTGSKQRRQRSTSQDLATTGRKYRSSRDLYRKTSPRRSRSSSRDPNYSSSPRQKVASRRKSANPEIASSSHSVDTKGLPSSQTGSTHTSDNRSRIRSKASRGVSGSTKSSHRRHRSLSRDAEQRERRRRSHSQDAQRVSSQKHTTRSPGSMRKSRSTRKFHSVNGSDSMRSPKDKSWGELAAVLGIPTAPSLEDDSQHKQKEGNGARSKSQEANDIARDTSTSQLNTSLSAMESEHDEKVRVQSSPASRQRDILGGSTRSLPSSMPGTPLASPRRKMKGRRPKQQEGISSETSNTLSSPTLSPTVETTRSIEDQEKQEKAESKFDTKGETKKETSAISSLEDFLAAPPQQRGQSTLREPSICSMSPTKDRKSKLERFEKLAEMSATKRNLQSLSPVNDSFLSKHLESKESFAALQEPSIGSSNEDDVELKKTSIADWTTSKPIEEGNSFQQKDIAPEENLLGASSTGGENLFAENFANFSPGNDSLAKDKIEASEVDGVEVLRHAASLKTRAVVKEGTLVEEETGQAEYLQLSFPDEPLKLPLPPEPVDQSLYEDNQESPGITTPSISKPTLFQRLASRGGARLD